jgi:putative ATP-binding cassette transporter
MGLFPVMSYAHICIGKIDSMKFSLAIPHKPYDPSPEPPPDKAWVSLELIGATHCYQVENQSSSFLLGPLDLCIYPGELIFITGGNGSGKTTLVKLLTGLYPPESGEIRFNDQIITEKNRDHYRQYFTATFSDFHLFDRLLGLEAADLDQQARSYLVKLHLDSKVQVQGGVFSTLDLSYGQRKRLALLTAFLEDRPIYVFDEWAADQDPQFREKFYYELLPELKSRGKTVIVITHDDRYYSVADRIIKLDYGKIAFDHDWPVVEELMRSAVSNLSR